MEKLNAPPFSASGRAGAGSAGTLASPLLDTPLPRAPYRPGIVARINNAATSLLSALARVLLHADVLTALFAILLFFSFTSGYWARFSEDDGFTGAQLLGGQVGAEFAPLLGASRVGIVALAVLPIVAIGSGLAAVAMRARPALAPVLSPLVSAAGLLAMAVGAVYLLERTAMPQFNRTLDLGFWLAYGGALGLAAQIFFRRPQPSALVWRFRVMGAMALVNAVVYALTLYAVVARSRENESVAFELVALIGLALYGAIIGFGITGNLYRRKGYSRWVGRGIGLILGAFGHLVLLIPLWVLLPSRNEHERVKVEEIAWGMVFLAPWLIAFILLTLFPMLDSYRIALYNWQGIGEPSQFVGLRHIQNVIKDPIFWQSVRNTVVYTAVLVPVQLTLALTLALILNRKRMRFSTFYRTLYFLPAVTSVAVVAIVMRLILGNFGTSVSELLGINPPVNPITSPQLALGSVIIFGMWHSFGVNLVYFMAALQTVPQELYDAAQVDGANALDQLLHVTLPSIRPISVIIVFMAVIGSMYVFEQSFVLTRGGPYFASQVVTQYVYNYAFRQSDIRLTPNFGYASSAALFFALMMLAITVTNYVISNRLRRNAA